MEQSQGTWPLPDNELHLLAEVLSLELSNLVDDSLALVQRPHFPFFQSVLIWANTRKKESPAEVQLKFQEILKDLIILLQEAHKLTEDNIRQGASSQKKSTPSDPQ